VGGVSVQKPQHEERGRKKSWDETCPDIKILSGDGRGANAGQLKGGGGRENAKGLESQNENNRDEQEGGGDESESAQKNCTRG